MTAPSLVAPSARRPLAFCVLLLVAGALFLRASARGDEPFGSGWPAGEWSHGGPLAIELRAHRRFVPPEPTRIDLDVRVAARENRGLRRPPLALAVVLDVSGSMEGEKLTQAKEAVRSLFAALEPADRVALVAYDDVPHLVLPLATASRARGELPRLLRRLQAGGGTRIPAALEAGFDALLDAPSASVGRVILVSDGLDEEGADAAPVARRRGGRAGVSALGVGLDFDEAYLARLALAGRGRFAFVEDGASLGELLRRELSRAGATALRDGRVTLELPPGVRFVSAAGFEVEAGPEVWAGHDVEARGGREVTVRLGDLAAGEEHRVLVELEAHLAVGARAAIRARLTGEAGEELREIRSAVQVLVGTGDPQLLREEDGDVRARGASVRASLQHLRARTLAADGDHGGAEALLAETLAEVRRAQAAAPADVAKTLGAQAATLEGALGAARAPSTGTARAAAKRALEADAENITGPGFGARR